MTKGFTQEYGIDYKETFASIAHITSVQTLLTIVAARQWPLTQLDVKNVFLNGELKEEVYMCLPLRYTCSTNKIFHLHKALYGLKQAPQTWFAKFHSTIGKLGFSSSGQDSTFHSTISKCMIFCFSVGTSHRTLFLALPRDKRISKKNTNTSSGEMINRIIGSINIKVSLKSQRGYNSVMKTIK